MLTKHFVTGIINRIDIGPRQNLIGLVAFSQTVLTFFTFNTYANSSKAEINQAIYDMYLLGENRNAALGLRSLVVRTFYRAILRRARLCHSKSSVHPSVRLSVTIRYVFFTQVGILRKQLHG